MPTCVDTLLCEMVRGEANGKVSLLGLFGEGILVPHIPIALPSLAIFQRWRPTTEELPGTRIRFAFLIRGPGLPEQRTPESEVTVPGPPRPLIQVGIQIQGL